MMMFTKGAVTKRRHTSSVVGFINRTFLTIGLVSFSMVAHSATINAINHVVLPGDQIQLQIELSEPIQDTPLSFTIENPARIALDFPNTKLNVTDRNQPVNVGEVDSVSAVEAAGRTRIVLNLFRTVPYNIEMQANVVVVTVGGTSAAVSSAPPASRVADGLAETVAPLRQVEAIDFKRGEAGEGRVIVTLSDSSIVVDTNKQGGDVILDFIGTSLPEKLNRRLDVIDFATAVKEIDVVRSGDDTRMTISTVTEKYDYLAYQSNQIFTVEVKTLTEAEEAERKKRIGFTGERLSLDFRNTDVTAILKLLAEFQGFNLVTDDSVGGNITLRLKNVPWDQALDIILKTKGLGMRKIDNVIMIAPRDQIIARERLELEASKQVEELAPLQTEFIQVNYARAEDLRTLIGTGGSESADSLLSARGSVTIDDRTNTLIVKDVATNINRIREMVNKLDVSVRQVLIESRIVNANENFAKDIGVRFGYSVQNNAGQGNLSARLAGGRTGFLDGTGTAIVGEGGVGADGAENIIVDLPAPNPIAPSVDFVVGKIGSWLLQLELSALIAEGDGENIASPRVITTDQQEAVIESGVEIPYQQATSSGATAVEFKDALLSLRVTPRITPDDKILLDLSVNQDSRGSPDVLGVPPINTRSVQTQVMVDNGETVVLGGVYTQTDDTTVNKVPFFGDLPYLGFLFRNSTNRKRKDELLIFVTPSILEESLKI